MKNYDVFDEVLLDTDGRKEYLEVLYDTLNTDCGYKYIKSLLITYQVGEVIPCSEWHVTMKNLGESLLNDIAEVSPEHFKRLSYEVRQKGER